MKNICILGFYLLCLTGIMNKSHALGIQGEPTSVLMGAARVNITPEEPVPMTGYASRTEPYTGVHDSLFATALYFQSPDYSLLLITADLIGYSRLFIDETRNKISAEIGMEPEHIIISAVHNHGAPVSKAYERDVPATVEQYVMDLQNKFVDISVQASKHLSPFKMGTGKGHCELNINRRAEFADGGIWLGRASDKPCDHVGKTGSTVLMTHCNGSSGYICTDKAFSEGGYEVKVSRLMPGAEPALRSELLQMINKL